MKIFVTDLDGTLLGPDHKLSEETQNYILDLRQKGYIFGVATGRPFPSAKDAVPNLEEIFDFGIFNNGGNFHDFKDQEIHHQYPLSGEDILELINTYAPMGANPILFVGNTMYTQDTDRYNDILKDADFEIVFGDVREAIQDTHEKIVFSVDLETREIVLDHAAKNPHPRHHAFLSQKELVEFQDMRVNKWVGIEYYLDKYNLRHIDTITFGDNENDLAMIEHATVGVAMDNAVPSVHKAADHRTLSAQAEGVPHFIRNYLKDFN